MNAFSKLISVVVIYKNIYSHTKFVPDTYIEYIRSHTNQCNSGCFIDLY